MLSETPIKEILIKKSKMTKTEKFARFLLRQEKNNNLKLIMSIIYISLGFIVISHSTYESFWGVIGGFIVTFIGFVEISKWYWRNND